MRTTDASSKLIERVKGVVRMKINLDDVDGEGYAVDIQCVRAVDMPRGAALLLNTHAAAKLGIILAPVSERAGAVSDLPEIECLVDLQRLRDSRLIGPRSTPSTAFLMPFDHTIRSLGLDHTGRRGGRACGSV